MSEADRARLLAASRVEWSVDFPKVSKRVHGGGADRRGAADLATTTRPSLRPSDANAYHATGTRVRSLPISIEKVLGQQSAYAYSAT